MHPRVSPTWSRRTRATARRRPDGADLVLLGGGELELPTHDWLHRLGFVSEELKHDALSGAAVVAVPSPYESLSLSQLEAWSHGRPTLANAASPVLVGQSRRSGGGLWYRDADEYAAMVDFLTRSQPVGDAIGRPGTQSRADRLQLGSRPGALARRACRRGPSS